MYIVKMGIKAWRSGKAFLQTLTHSKVPETNIPPHVDTCGLRMKRLNTDTVQIENKVQTNVNNPNKPRVINSIEYKKMQAEAKAKAEALAKAKAEAEARAKAEALAKAKAEAEAKAKAEALAKAKAEARVKEQAEMRALAEEKGWYKIKNNLNTEMNQTKAEAEVLYKSGELSRIEGNPHTGNQKVDDCIEAFWKSSGYKNSNMYYPDYNHFRYNKSENTVEFFDIKADKLKHYCSYNVDTKLPIKEMQFSGELNTPNLYELHDAQNGNIVKSIYLNNSKTCVLPYIKTFNPKTEELIERLTFPID